MDAVAVQGKTAENVKKMTAMECKPCLVRMKNILYNSLYRLKIATGYFLQDNRTDENESVYWIEKT